MRGFAIMTDEEPQSPVPVAARPRRTRIVEVILILFVLVTGVSILAPRDTVAGVLGQRAYAWMTVATTLLAAAVNGAVWARRDHFWLPRYVHVLAALGLAGTTWMAWLDRESWSTRPVFTIGFILLGPAVVYVVFLAYNGVTESLKGRGRAT
jgi:hypothetical protein